MITLCSILTNFKDKWELEKITDCKYKIHCQGCNITDTGETQTAFVTRKQEHIKANFPRANDKVSKSAFLILNLADHVLQKNHIIPCEEISVLTTECDPARVKEFMWVGG